MLGNMGNVTVLDRMRQAYQQNPGKAIAIGLGVALVTPTLLPLLKPVAKATIKTGVSVFEKTKGALAETGEVLGDIVAEAKAEVAAEQARKVQGGLVSASEKQVNT